MSSKSDEPRPDTPNTDTPGADDATRRSELEEGVEHLGRAFGGVMTRLFGAKVTGQEAPEQRPVVSPEADAAIDQAGRTLGRWLHAAGEALAEHPAAPSEALDAARKAAPNEVPEEEGLTPLSVGLKSMAKGLARSGEAVLDQVAPRKTKAKGDPESGDPPTGPRRCSARRARAVSTPSRGATPLRRPVKDPRWPDSQGWTWKPARSSS